MDYFIYIVLAVLGVIFFVGQGFTRKRSRERKSRNFMEDYKKNNKSKSKE